MAFLAARVGKLGWTMGEQDGHHIRGCAAAKPTNSNSNTFLFGTMIHIEKGNFKLTIGFVLLLCRSDAEWCILNTHFKHLALFNHTVQCGKRVFSWKATSPCTIFKQMKLNSYGITDWISSGFYSKRFKWLGCRDRWLSNWTWLNTNTHSGLVQPQPWNMPMIEFSHVTACGLDITVQGHFLKCAPSTHPTSFPPYPNKSCFSGKSAQPLMFLHKAKTMLASRLWSSACLFKNYRALQLFPDSVQCLICSKECTQLTSHYMQETSKRWSFIALAVHQKGSIHHYPLALIWLLIKVACPRWVPTVWTNYLLNMFQMLRLHLETLTPY